MENFDVKEMARDIMATAQKALQTDGHLVPVCFIVSLDQTEAVPIPFGSEAEKHFSMHVITEYAKMKKALAVISLNDAYCATAKTKEEIEKIRPGDLSRLPESEREECIILGCKQANGACWGLIATYKRVKDDAGKEKLEFATPYETDTLQIQMIPDFGAEGGQNAN
jgi:hypothetical protein